MLFRKHLKRFKKNKLLKNDLMFNSLCEFLAISKKEGLKLASVDKTSPTPINVYFKDIKDFSEINVIKGWSSDKYQPLRNLYFHINKDYKWLMDDMDINENDRILDYGCSTSFFTYYCIKNNFKMNITLADIDSPQFNFCKYFYKDYVKEFITIKPGELPLKNSYTKIIIYDVLEHVNSPLNLIKHLMEHLENQGKLIETFILDKEIKNRTNLKSAIEQRGEFFRHMLDNYNLLSGVANENPGPRIWEMKS